MDTSSRQLLGRRASLVSRTVRKATAEQSPKMRRLKVAGSGMGLAVIAEVVVPE